MSVLVGLAPRLVWEIKYIHNSCVFIVLLVWISMTQSQAMIFSGATNFEEPF